MDEHDSLEQVLSRGGPGVQELAEALRKLVRGAAPQATERGHIGWGNIAYEVKGAVG
jgi:pyridoxal biosynthesis lyase PdxS